MKLPLWGYLLIKAIVSCHPYSATWKISGFGECKSLQPETVFDLMANGRDCRRDGHKGSIP